MLESQVRTFVSGHRASRVAAAVGIAAGLALRAAYILHHRVNSDEPQHLHVAWAWTRHLLPYRDVFDNHSPLFGMLLSGVVAAFGERPDIVLLARLAMIPLVALALGATWVVARRLFSSEGAWWAVAIAAVSPDFLLGSVEFRTDQLWTALWMVTLAVLLAGRFTRTRAAAAGLLLGATFAASMKTSLLLAALILSGAALPALLRSRGARVSWRDHVPHVGLALAGLCAVPALLAGFFASQGAFGPMLYGVIGHNLVPGLGMWTKSPYRILWLPLALPALWLLARAIVRRAPDAGTGARRALLVLTAGGYGVGLETCWPLVTRQDVLPLVPMAAAALVPFLTQPPPAGDRGWLAAGRFRLPWAVPALALAAQMAWVTAIEPAWEDHTGPEVAFLQTVLRLTRPGDPVMDLRGETVFRNRPYYYALEEITRARIRKGMMPDDIARQLTATRTAVAIGDSEEFPPQARGFMNANYLDVGDLRVAGLVLDPARGEARGAREFDIRIRQRYALISQRGPARGRLDGAAYDAPLDLSMGPHTYQPSSGEGAVAVVWAPAVARGFFPSGFTGRTP